MVTWVTTFLLCVVILIMHFLMPQAVLDKYFKQPYFKKIERELFSGIPYAPMRTIMLMRAIANPKSGKVRGITEANLLAPKWYRVSSKIVVVSIYINAILLLVAIIGGGLFYFMGW
jgi:hypothetical protein